MPSPSHFLDSITRSTFCVRYISQAHHCAATQCLPHTVKLYLCTLWCHVETGCTAPLILNLGTRWRWLVSFTLRSPYCQRKGPR
jgi:hypothetical protein